MKHKETRMKRLEHETTPEPVFFSWGREWTPEEQAEAIRNDPGQRMYWMSLLKLCEEIRDENAGKEKAEQAAAEADSSGGPH